MDQSSSPLFSQQKFAASWLKWMGADVLVGEVVF
jgi:hypothetical protein